MRKLRRYGQDHPRHRRRLIARVAAGGALASAASAAAAFACSHGENGHGARPFNAIVHIVDGGPPPAHDGRNGRNTLLGLAIHTAACFFWSACYEAVLGRQARRSVPRALGAGAAIAATAYVVDYYVVSSRFRPGIEAHLSGKAMFAVYAALGAGFAAAALVTRRRSGPRATPRQRARPKAAVPA